MLHYIYIDILFFENFIINYIVLKLTSKYLNVKIKSFRNFAGAFVASIYSLFVFYPEIKILYTLLFKLIIACLIVIITFNVNSLKDYFNKIIAFYIINCILGGCIFGIFYLNNNLGYYNNGVFYIYNFSIKAVLIGIIGTYLIVKGIKNTINKNKNLESFINVKVVFEEKAIELVGFVDTGNFLKDPITKKPVMVVEFESLKTILPKEIVNMYLEDSIGDFENLIKVIMMSKWVSKFKLIPFSSLGMQNGMIMGFKPDYIEILLKNKILKTTEVIIAISNNKISDDNRYQVILNPNILNEID